MSPGPGSSVPPSRCVKSPRTLLCASESSSSLSKAGRVTATGTTTPGKSTISWRGRIGSTSGRGSAAVTEALLRLAGAGSGAALCSGSRASIVSGAGDRQFDPEQPLALRGGDLLDHDVDRQRDLARKGPA